MELARREDRMTTGSSGRNWSDKEARIAEEYEAGRRLLVAVIHQAMMDTMMDFTPSNGAVIRAAFDFLFDSESRYFELLGLEQEVFREHFLRRMQNLKTLDKQFSRERKERFLSNYASHHMYWPVKTPVPIRAVFSQSAEQNSRRLAA